MAAAFGGGSETAAGDVASAAETAQIGILNSKFKIQNSKLTKTESSIELLSVFYREFNEFKEFRENHFLDSFSNNWLFGFRVYPRRGYDEKEIWSCQVYLNKLHISYLSVIAAR